VAPLHTLEIVILDAEDRLAQGLHPWIHSRLPDRELGTRYHAGRPNSLAATAAFKDYTNKDISREGDHV
jgi:hypothetical protein